MPSSYSPSLRLELQADAENNGTWGQILNRVLTLIEQSVAGVLNLALSDADYTLTASNGLSDQARNMILNFSGTLTATRTITVPAVTKVYIIRNAASQTLNIKTASGTAVAVAAGSVKMVYIDSSANAVGVTQDEGATISAGDGSAAAPSITNAGDTNTGFWFPAENTIAITQGGAESARFVYNGPLLLGKATTTSNDFIIDGSNGGASGSRLFKFTGAASNSLYGYSDGSGVGITRTDPYSNILYLHNDGTCSLYASSGNRMHLTYQGYLKAGNTVNFGGVAGVADQTTTNTHILQSNQATVTSAIINSSTSVDVTNLFSALPTGSMGYHYRGLVNGINTVLIYANGNIQNTNNSYGAYSDERLKENIVDSKSFSEKFMKVRFRAFNFIGSEQEHFGVVAQELEGVFPSLVEEVPYEGKDHLVKTVKYSVLASIQGKVIQEQQKQIEALEARLSVLEALCSKS